MGVDGERLGLLVDGIYDAAVGVAPWESVLSRVAESIGASSAAAVWFDQKRQELQRSDLWNTDPDAMRTYAREFVGICPRFRMSRRLLPGAVYDDRNARLSNAPVLRPYYDFMDSVESGLAQVVLVEKNASLAVGISFYSRFDGEREPDNRLLSFLSPHLRRASNLAFTLALSRAQLSLFDALFALSDATLVVDASGKILLANEAALALIRARDGFSVDLGRIVASLGGDDRRLREELAAVLQPVEGRPLASEGVVLVQRPSGDPPFAVSLVPISQEVWPTTHDGRAAVMRIVETRRTVSPALLRKLFGLGKAEAEVATAVATGIDLNEIARRRATSIHTVRAQVKAILTKVGVSSQTELAATIASLGRL